MLLSYRHGGKLYEISESDGRLIISTERAGKRFRLTVTALEDIVLRSAVKEEGCFDPSAPVIANGFQSWTETREFLPGEFLNDLGYVPAFLEKRFNFKAYGSQAFLKARPGTLTAFDWAQLRGEEPAFFGSFNGANAWLIIEFDRNSGKIALSSDIDGRALKKGESFTVFDYIKDENGDEYFASFTPRSQRKLFGYTSWYNHYENINEEIVSAALKKADERLELFQIDDGYETHVGDWLDVDKKKFPNGLEPVLEKIHEKGMLAGIWLAPFAAARSSRLFSEHPDWVAKDESGAFIGAGGNWGGFCPLNLDVDEAKDYVRDCLKHYADMGFDFFKLDFIYAASLKPMKEKTRAETAEFACSLLREALGDKLILACGATLSNCAGRFDYCRIGPDVSLSFDDVFYMRRFHPERVSTKVTLVNTIYRSPMNGRMFLNDPDVFLLRDSNIRLTKDQKKALTVINALFGSLLMTSDDGSDYGEESKALMEEALVIFRRGRALSYERRGDVIAIECALDGRRRSISYDFRNGRLTKQAGEGAGDEGQN
ncbi:MAG: alpha-galactosidase [Firmicutes bacterium]|nr:alpha-galactosidase [Bacillota bacterium]